MENVRTDIQKMCARAIRLVEWAAREHFGINFKVGIEQEFFATSELGSKPSRKFMRYLDSFDEMGNRRPDKLSSPMILRAYKESPTNQYEITTPPANALRTAARGIALKCLIENMACDFDMENVSFSPFRNNTAYGLHINISTWSGATNLTSDSTKSGMSHLQSLYVRNFITRNPLLIYLTDEDYQRLGEFSPVVKKKGTNNNDSRLENGLPGAYSDPYAALLLTVAGAYKGYQMHTTGINCAARGTDFPNNFNDAISETDKPRENEFVELLDRLAKEYNARLYADVKSGKTTKQAADSRKIPEKLGTQIVTEALKQIESKRSAVAR